MAKRCVTNVNWNGSVRNCVQINDFSILSNTSSWTVFSYRSTLPSYVTSVGDRFLVTDSSYISSSMQYEQIIDTNANLSTKSNTWSYQGSTFYDVKTKITRNNSDFEFGISEWTGNADDIYWGFVLDDETHEGWALCLRHNGNGWEMQAGYGTRDNVEYIYWAFYPEEISGGAGSGYIGNSILSNKKMVGYNVPTSSAESTKTESVSEASENPVSGKPKIGNGFARIKFLREPSTFSFGDLAKTLDITHKQVTGWDNSGIEDGVVTQYLSSYFGTDYILVAQQNNGNYFYTFDGNEGIGHEITMYTGCAIYYPIRPIIVTKIKCSSKFDTTGSLTDASFFELYVGYIENGSMNHITVGSHNKSKEWGIIEKEFDSPVKVEYIEFVVMDNQWHFKDVEITGVLL